MPEWWSWTALAVGVLVVCLLAPLVWLFARRRWLAGQGRVFECALHRVDARGAGWTLGVARFRDDVVEWYRIFSLSLRPAYRFRRDETSVERVRPPDAGEASELYEGHVVAELGGRYAGVRLGMARPDLTAFSSWTEAAPPGGNGNTRP